ncbi:MAG: nucleotidyl transferase AbiEii/AbiGii toxin family protein [Deltaproteobacteria bacterium]|nr:nucleotidyl transferase AbiEii/AbiGii toxin family protein [Deltaproteobacteria bacterium]
MQTQNDFVHVIESLIKDLEEKGFNPVMVGGMALALMGSQRVTFDCDFLISLQDLLAETIIEVFYKHGFELVSKLNERREVIRTIDNPRIAAVRLKLDEPPSAFFYNYNIKFKIDLLFDFPLPAKEIASRSVKIKARAHHLRIASIEDLIRLKEIAYADRKLSTDLQDLEFLRNYRKKSK